MRYLFYLLLVCTSLWAANEEESRDFFLDDQHTRIMPLFETNQTLDARKVANHRSDFHRDKDLIASDVLIDAALRDFWYLFAPKPHYFKHTWVMLTLDANLSSGTYWLDCSHFPFDVDTFDTTQQVTYFSILGHRYLSFGYQKDQDSRSYYFHITDNIASFAPLTALYTPSEFTALLNKFSLQTLLSSLLLGLILMTAFYYGILYIFNRETPLLYYALMQSLMIGTLLYSLPMAGVLLTSHLWTLVPMVLLYFLLINLTSLYLVKFLRSFLQTGHYLPRHDKALHLVSKLLVIDMFLFVIPVFFLLSLYIPLMLYALYVIFLRMRQGSKKASFIFWGWMALSTGIISSEIWTSLWVEPMLIGSVIEALLFSSALAYTIRENRQIQEMQKQMLIHQSKLASMGEMLANIAHQWRQPLSRLGYILMNIENQDTGHRHAKKLQQASTQLTFMSETIDDFRDFYKTDKTKTHFSLAQESQKVCDLILFHQIEVVFNVIEDAEAHNYKNEYKQVLLNLLSNAKEVLLARNISKPVITIEIDKTTVSVSDNAGGIDVDPIEKVFEPYFSTKTDGMGIGLYMSKHITEHRMDGKLSVSNTSIGARFLIKLS